MRISDWSSDVCSSDLVGSRGHGESVWLAWFIIATIRNFTRHCLDENQTGFRDRWNGRADSLAAAVERSAWDGEWYLRAFDDDGRAWGTSEEQERSEERRDGKEGGRTGRSRWGPYQ